MSRALPEGHRRTHPLTPLVTGWRIILGVIGIATAQNVVALVQDFTLRRLLIGAAILAAIIVVSVAGSFLSWRATSYGVDAGGVAKHSGVLSRSREYAPRERIESVSVERPLLARLLGLAKVRIEVAGGGESYLDVEYVRSDLAEELRVRILEVSAGEAPPRQFPDAGADPAAPETTAEDGPPSPAGPACGELPGAAARPTHAGTAANGTGSPARSLRSFLHDGVTDGEAIAEIPTSRLVRALLRDTEFVIGTVMSAVGVAVAVTLAIWQDGLNPAILLPLLPALIAVPRFVLGRIESGWGFVSRITERGLRMRRGLANTRTDNIAAGRIQRLDLRRPLLWRSQGWTAVSVTVAGIDDDSDSGAQNVLPVGTGEELALTIGHLAPPLGTQDDLATLEHLLTARARDIEGMHVTRRWHPIARRTHATVLLPGALVRRTGMFSRRVEIVPRDRIQQLTLGDGVLARRLGVLSLAVAVAGHTVSIDPLRREDALDLHRQLRRDAASLRRYSDRSRWPMPALSLPEQAR